MSRNAVSDFDLYAQSVGGQFSGDVGEDLATGNGITTDAGWNPLPPLFKDASGWRDAFGWGNGLDADSGNPPPSPVGAVAVVIEAAPAEGAIAGTIWEGTVGVITAATLPEWAAALAIVGLLGLVGAGIYVATGEDTDGATAGELTDGRIPHEWQTPWGAEPYSGRTGGEYTGRVANPRDGGGTYHETADGNTEFRPSWNRHGNPAWDQTYEPRGGRLYWPGEHNPWRSPVLEEVRNYEQDDAGRWIKKFAAGDGSIDAVVPGFISSFLDALFGGSFAGGYGLGTGGYGGGGPSGGGSSGGSGGTNGTGGSGGNSGGGGGDNGSDCPDVCIELLEMISHTGPFLPLPPAPTKLVQILQGVLSTAAVNMQVVSALVALAVTARIRFVALR